MTFALLLAGSVAAIAVSLVILVQALLARADERAFARKRAIVDLARTLGGVVTPRAIAAKLGTTPLEADRLLRSMVDDVHLTMEIDDQEGELRFTFTGISGRGPSTPGSKPPTRAHSIAPKTT
jgi:hypothetical protein